MPVTIALCTISVGSLSPIALSAAAILTLIHKQVQLRVTQVANSMQIPLFLLANTPPEIEQKDIINHSHNLQKN